MTMLRAFPSALLLLWQGLGACWWGLTAAIDWGKAPSQLEADSDDYLVVLVCVL